MRIASTLATACVVRSGTCTLISGGLFRLSLSGAFKSPLDEVSVVRKATSAVGGLSARQVILLTNTSPAPWQVTDGSLVAGPLVANVFGSALIVKHKGRGRLGLSIGYLVWWEVIGAAGTLLTLLVSTLLRLGGIDVLRRRLRGRRRKERDADARSRRSLVSHEGHARLGEVGKKLS